MYRIKPDLLVAVATDRISAFDVILPRAIPGKGQVLNQIAAHFLQQTNDIVPNWLLEVPDPNVSIGRQCQPFQIEMVIRDCLIGYSWRLYDSGKRQICGINLPDGLNQYDRFAQPIITPSTKADSGHDEDISAQEIVAQGLASQNEFDELSRLAKELFNRGQAIAAKQGLYLADTKYEFGKTPDGQIYLIDEVHTPDSSRYFYKESYQNYVSGKNKTLPKHLSKEFVREWLMDNGFSGQDGQTMPKMTDAFVISVSQHYEELYEQLTGHRFVVADDSLDIAERIKKNVSSALEKLNV